MDKSFQWLASLIDPDNLFGYDGVFVSRGMGYACGTTTTSGGASNMYVAPVTLPDGKYDKTGRLLASGSDFIPKIEGFVDRCPPDSFINPHFCQATDVVSVIPNGARVPAELVFAATQERGATVYYVDNPEAPILAFSEYGWAYFSPLRKTDTPRPYAETQRKFQIWHHPESDSAFLTGPDYEPTDPALVPVEAYDLPAGAVIEGVGMGQSVVRPSMDFETYSEAGFIIDDRTGKVKTAARSGNKNGLSLVGTPVYAEHPSTEVLCLYYDLKDGLGRRGWTPMMPPPTDLLNHIANGGSIAAWNVTFEWWIWNMVCVRKYGWPLLQIEQCYCDMAKSRRYSRPGPLADAAKSFGTSDKDKEGKRLIGKLCRPVSATKNRPIPRWTFDTAPEDYSALFAYCDQDVKVEDEISALIPDMTAYDRERWLIDQRINARGVQVDVESLDACLVIMDKMTAKFTDELHGITNGAVETVGQTERLIAFLATQSCYVPDMKSETVENTLKRDDINPLARRVLEIRDALAGANIKKLPALKAQINSDGRLRNQYAYNSAATGRWASQGVQLQNFTSKGPKVIRCKDCGRYVSKDCELPVLGVTGYCPDCGGGNWDAGKYDPATGKWSFLDWCVDAVEYALADIRTGDLDLVMAIWGDPATVLAGCLRGLLIAKPDYKFVCCDFSAIEAVGLAALARCEWRLEVFRTHGKIYEMSASKISGVPFEEMLQYKKDNGHDHPLRKSLGKVAELASGFGGWIGAWKAFGADAHFKDDDEMKKAILAWRDASPEIVEFWGGQWRGGWREGWRYECYGLEGAAISAIRNPGNYYRVNDIVYGMVGDCLYCQLPSGRFLQYHNARAVQSEDRLGRGLQYTILFDAYNTNPKNGPIGWTTIETYGGKLTENVDQAACADIQGEAMVRCEAAGYAVVMHTHDELIAEVPESFGSVEEMAALMSTTSEWNSWWPIRAAGWQGKRYRKD